ncbi:MAG TPA: hypothetical protein EYP24_02760 [bacterium (Candidatus Stahlbacteria)]|nr:hypothetical protein [Candidatus Stahlbacteria bacterium]
MRFDILTPRERFGLLVIDELPDRCNIIPLITSHAATVADIPLRRYYTEGQAMAEAQIIAFERYGHDALSIFSEVGIIAEAIGSVFDYPEDDLPVIRLPILTKVGIEDLKVPDPKRDGRLPIYLEAIKYAYNSLGDRVPILAYVPAPFTTGVMLSDPNQFLIDTIRNPDRIHRIMELGLKAAKGFCYEIINTGGLPILVDPLASASVISPKAYKEFALPYEQRLIDYLHRYDLDIILHICGETGPIIDLMLDSHADLLSVDRIDPEFLYEKCHDRIRIIGNLDTSLVGFGAREEVIKRTAEMVARLKMAKKGYVAATGCEVPIRADPGNVEVFIQIAREVGWFWD